MQQLLYTCLFVLLCTSCIQSESEPFSNTNFDGTAYRPVYATADQFENVQVTAPAALSDPGKIYVSGQYLFVNERGKGVHIIDNTDRKNPVNISFISILSNFDIAAKGNWLYADNGGDLLVFDISDPKLPKLTKRISGAFPVNNYPPYQNIFFECADAKKGVIVGWEKVVVDKEPGCFR